MKMQKIEIGGLLGTEKTLIPKVWDNPAAITYWHFGFVAFESR